MRRDTARVMRLRVLRSLAALALIVGVALIVVGFSRNERGAQGAASITPFDIRTPTPAQETTPGPPGETTPDAAADTTTGAVATAPPVTAAPSSNGAVARMLIPSVGVDYPIEEIGLLPNNALDTPHDALGKIGWYSIYKKPGSGGNAVFSAHVNYDFKQGPFANLAKVQPGDEIDIQMDDGSKYTYRIFRKQRYDVANMPMGELIWPSDRPSGKEWITLITCGGNFVATQANGLGEYTQRDVVVAERVS